MVDHHEAPDGLRRALVVGVAAALTGCESSSAGPVPEVALPPISGLRTGGGWDLPGVDTRTFAGQITVLNIWASWCPYCRGEHDLLKRLSGDARLRLVGLVHRDSADNALAYLRAAGNPFAALSVDVDSKIAGALGQRGVPHTYVIGRDMRVALKIPGALSEGTISQKLLPAVEKARAG